MKIHSLLLGAALLSGCSGAIDVGPGAGGGFGIDEHGAIAGGVAVDENGDVGGVIAGGGSSGAPNANTCTDDTPLPTWPTSIDCVPSSDLPLVGIWHGYVELAAAPWDDFTLVIKGASVSGGLCGTLTFGSGPPPAPATDPNLGYPQPEQAPSQYGATLLPGYAYTLQNGSTDGSRVQFEVLASEAYHGWCQLQTSFAGHNGSSCDCLPSEPSIASFATEQCYYIDSMSGQQPVDCSKASLCSAIDQACTCNSTGCDSSRTPGGDSYAAFDVLFSGDTADGSNTAVRSSRTRFSREP